MRARRLRSHRQGCDKLSRFSTAAPLDILVGCLQIVSRRKKTMTVNPSSDRVTAATTSDRNSQSVETTPAWVTKGRAWLRSFGRRLVVGLICLSGLFLLVRFIWLTGWYWPYRLIHGYLSEQLPMAEPWAIQTLALLVAVLIAAEIGAILSFILVGRHGRVVIGLVMVAVLAHGGLSWYRHDHVMVDDQGHVRVRVVESPDGTLKLIDRAFDPETGRAARWATEADLVMLEVQRNNRRVERVGPEGPFRSAQGTIIVYYTRRDGPIVLYSGPRHQDVSGDMPQATDQIINEFLRQRR
jgi:hypothetical protein